MKGQGLRECGRAEDGWGGRASREGRRAERPRTGRRCGCGQVSSRVESVLWCYVSAVEAAVVVLELGRRVECTLPPIIRMTAGEIADADSCFRAARRAR